MQPAKRSIRFLFSMNCIFDFHSIAYSFLNHLEFFGQRANKYPTSLDLGHLAPLEDLLMNLKNNYILQNIDFDRNKTGLLQSLSHQFNLHQNEIRPFIGSIRVLEHLIKQAQDSTSEINAEVWSFADHWWTLSARDKLAG